MYPRVFLFQLSKRYIFFSILLKLNPIFTLEFTCNDGTLGDGKEGDTLTGPCEKGKEGTIKYRCRSGKWESEESNCVLQVIKDLEKEIQVIFTFYL